MKKVVSLVVCCIMFIGCDQIADSVASKVTIKMIEPITAAMKEIKTDAFKSAHVQ